MDMTATLYNVQMPMLKSFGHAASARNIAECILLIAQKDGVISVGECVPRPYVTGESFATAWTALTNFDLSKAFSSLSLKSPSASLASIEQMKLRQLLAPPNPALAASCAVELCLLDFAGQRQRIPLREFAKHLGLPEGVVKDEILTDPITVCLDFLKSPLELSAYAGQGITHVKIKVGEDIERDARRIAECRKIFGLNVTLSVDANMAWNLETAVQAARAFAPYNLTWYEEPLKVNERHRYPELRKISGIKVMLDESGCSFAQISSAIQSEACDMINIRISKCGGFAASLRLVELAHKHNIGYQLGIQVGQMGFLMAATRQFSSTVSGIQACEGGIEIENFPDQITDKILRYDWRKMYLFGVEGTGIGVKPNIGVIEKYAVQKALWDGSKWLS